MLTVTEINDPEALIALRPAWDDLADRASVNDPYTRFEYVYPWSKYAARGNRLRALFVWDRDRLVGFAPLMSGTTRKLGVNVLRVSFLARGMVPPCDLIVSDSKEEVVEAIFDHLVSGPRWDVLQLLPVPAESPHIVFLERLARKRRLAVAQRQNRHGLFVEFGGTWQTYLKRMERRDRKEFPKMVRRIEERGRVMFERRAGRDLDLDLVMDDVLGVIGRSWKGREGVDSGFLAFLNEFARSLRERGWLGVSFFRLDGRALAFVYEILYRDRLFAFYSAYDEAYSAYGPGILLMSWILQQGFEDGIRAYDFGTDWSYLRRWPHRSRSLNELAIFQNTFAATMFRYWHFNLRPMMSRSGLGAAARQRSGV